MDKIFVICVSVFVLALVIVAGAAIMNMETNPDEDWFDEHTEQLYKDQTTAHYRTMVNGNMGKVMEYIGSHGGIYENTAGNYAYWYKLL